MSSSTWPPSVIPLFPPPVTSIYTRHFLFPIPLSPWSLRFTNNRHSDFYHTSPHHLIVARLLNLGSSRLPTLSPASSAQPGSLHHKATPPKPAPSLVIFNPSPRSYCPRLPSNFWWPYLLCYQPTWSIANPTSLRGSLHSRWSRHAQRLGRTQWPTLGYRCFGDKGDVEDITEGESSPCHSAPHKWTLFTHYSWR